ncbi:hypothetical protein IV203_035329 [Nitzschia inconspicua]|uniref:Uncharacterized protein n=1 Tax=Nitzschia inconspicua TaxID=303405 RepID=A0A9K3LD45_9STRA|nr:hypothetical protein IV203_035329 [Nitzschia inconspicua]
MRFITFTSYVFFAFTKFGQSDPIPNETKFRSLSSLDKFAKEGGGFHQDEEWSKLTTINHQNKQERRTLSDYQQTQQSFGRSLQINDIEISECSICGEGRKVTLPETTVEVPTDSRSIMIVTCHELERYGHKGNISSILCPLVQPLVQDFCGCEDDQILTPTDAGGSNPTEASNTTMTSDNPTATSGAEFWTNEWSHVYLHSTSPRLVTIRYLPPSRQINDLQFSVTYQVVPFDGMIGKRS